MGRPGTGRPRIATSQVEQKSGHHRLLEQLHGGAVLDRFGQLFTVSGSYLVALAPGNSIS